MRGNVALPKNIFFLTDFYLAKNEQLEPRLTIAKYAAERGLNRFGGEFLFIRTEDVSNLKKQAQQALGIKEQLDSLFDKTYFSIHAPWVPFEKTGFEFGKTQFNNILQLLDFCPEFVKILNVHAGTVSLEYWNKKLKNNPNQKKQNMELVRNRLDELADLDSRICVETLFAPLDEENGANYLANLPKDVLQLAKNKKVGITVDTAHAGMTIESCKKMIQNRELFNGYFENEWDEIKKTALGGRKEFTAFGKKINHIHFNDFKSGEKAVPAGLADGAIPGLGTTPKKELYEWLNALAEGSGKKEIGAALEIKEKSYGKLKNQQKTIQIIADYYGL
ncbi:MAG: hypothetical protein V1777_05545 [Candidatus Micrarchaeota archaeon]